MYPGDTPETEMPPNHKMVNYVIDSLFFIDICIIFNTATYNDNYEVVKNRNEIAYYYLTTWFFLDFVTILPFDAFFPTGGSNNMLRMARLGRINKILKLMKLIRLMKM